MRLASPLDPNADPHALLSGSPTDPSRTHSVGVERGRLARFFSLRLRRRARERPSRTDCGQGLFLGSSPTLADLEDLVRRDGLRSLVNLNTEGEPGERLSPNVEASWAHALDLVHERVSMTSETPRSEDVDRFLRVLASVARPVFVHSRLGRRAAALILIHLGLEQGSSGAATVQGAVGSGILCTDDVLRHFAESEIDRRQAGQESAG